MLPMYTVVKKILLAALVSFPLSASPVGGADHHDMTIWDILLKRSGGTDAMDHNRYDYDILVKLLITANLDEKASDENAELTVFAPNDGAFFTFAKNSGYEKGYHEDEIYDFLLEAYSTLGDPIEFLISGTLYHMVDGVLTSDAIRQRASTRRPMFTLLKGATILPKKSGRFIYLGDEDPTHTDSRVIRPHNLKAKNGIVHTVNRILLSYLRE
jgi:serralysin